MSHDTTDEDALHDVSEPIIKKAILESKFNTLGSSLALRRGEIRRYSFLSFVFYVLLMCRSIANLEQHDSHRAETIDLL